MRILGHVSKGAVQEEVPTPVMMELAQEGNPELPQLLRALQCPSEWAPLLSHLDTQRCPSLSGGPQQKRGCARAVKHPASTASSTRAHLERPSGRAG